MLRDVATRVHDAAMNRGTRTNPLEIIKDSDLLARNDGTLYRSSSWGSALAIPGGYRGPGEVRSGRGWARLAATDVTRGSPARVGRPSRCWDRRQAVRPDEQVLADRELRDNWFPAGQRPRKPFTTPGKPPHCPGNLRPVHQQPAALSASYSDITIRPAVDPPPRAHAARHDLVSVGDHGWRRGLRERAVLRRPSGSSRPGHGQGRRWSTTATAVWSCTRSRWGPCVSWSAGGWDIA